MGENINMYSDYEDSNSRCVELKKNRKEKRGQKQKNWKTSVEYK